MSMLLISIALMFSAPANCSLRLRVMYSPCTIESQFLCSTLWSYIEFQRLSHKNKDSISYGYHLSYLCLNDLAMIETEHNKCGTNGVFLERISYSACIAVCNRTHDCVLNMKYCTIVLCRGSGQVYGLQYHRIGKVPHLRQEHFLNRPLFKLRPMCFSCLCYRCKLINVC